MSRWLGRGVIAALGVLFACKVKKHEQDPAPVAEIPAIKPADIEPPGISPSPPLRAAALPECEAYQRAVERVASCTTVPYVTRQAMKDAYTALVTNAGPYESAVTMKAECTDGLDTVKQIGSACPAIAPGTQSRDVPSERGVPFDRTALGSLPHPFGALEALKPGISREDILQALPNAQRDGEDGITVPVGVEDLMANIGIDYTGHLDVVRIQLSGDARDLLTKAWGKPSAVGAWFDRKKRWRADLDESNELMIGPFTPLADLLGKGPDGLAETKAMLGATPAELTARFGTRIREFEVESDDGEQTGEKRYELLVPATEVCKFYTYVEAQLAAGRVSRVRVTQCYDDEANRRAALAAMESKWGKVVPGRSAEDRPVFTFAAPGHKIEMAIDEQDQDHPGWQLAITK